MNNVLKPFKWFLLGIGYICYLFYITLRYILFSVGYTIVNFFVLLFDAITLRHVLDHKKSKKIIEKKAKNLNTEFLAAENKHDFKKEVRAEITDLNNKENIQNKSFLESNLANLNKNNEKTEKIDLAGLNNKNNEIKEKIDLVDLNKNNKKPEEINVVDLNNKNNKKSEENNIVDLNKKNSKEKKEEKKELKTKFVKEDKIFKEIDVKPTFHDRLGMAFPTLFGPKEKNIKDITTKSDSTDYINSTNEIEEKEKPKIVYEYTAKNKNGKMEKNYLEAYSLVEVQSYLLSEGYEVYRIRTNQSINIFHRTATGKKKIKVNDLVFFLTQLSTYIKAGITLTESVDILSRQFKNKYYQKIFRSIANSLKSGDNFSEALSKTGNVFPRLLINMVKTAELTGDLPETLDDMADYYSEIDKTRKQMKSALTYPTIVLILAVGVVAFVLIYVIPKFTSIYESMNSASIPKLTLVIISMSDFIKANYYYIALAFIVLLLLLKYLYQHRISSRAFMQKVAMKIPVLKDVIIYNEVTTFTKTFSSLLKHGVFITDTMNILMQITNNEIYKKLIYNCINHLNKGESISLAFKGHWAFPVPAYEMIVTGERTGKLPDMLAKVSEYYQELHSNIVSRMKAIVEPVLIILLTGIVGLIILAVIVPMFGIYSSIQ